MPVKTMFVLANSAKVQNRCVAGREIVTESDGGRYWGGWLRPVSTHDQGALNFSECRLQDNCIPAPLDVIQVPCLKCENCPTQPENWIIQDGGAWKRLGNLELDSAQNLIEAPPDLWLDAYAKTDRVGPEYLEFLEGHQSLYLIRPEDFSVEIEPHPFRNGNRARGCFHYNGTYYRLSITDPFFSRRYFPYISSYEPGRIDIGNVQGLFICVSLTPEFQGYHYKVIASVFKPIDDNMGAVAAIDDTEDIPF